MCVAVHAVSKILMMLYKLLFCDISFTTSFTYHRYDNPRSWSCEVRNASPVWVNNPCFNLYPATHVVTLDHVIDPGPRLFLIMIWTCSSTILGLSLQQWHKNVHTLNLLVGFLMYLNSANAWFSVFHNFITNISCIGVQNSSCHCMYHYL